MNATRSPHAFRTSQQTNRRLWLAVCAVAVPLGVALGLLVVPTGHVSPRIPGAAAFSWLHPEAPPRGWGLAATRAGATLAYPPGWHTIHTDPGTASAAPDGAGGAFAGYLNATPRAGEETLANWSRFRVAHVSAEGARFVRLEAAATGLRFRSASGSCVIDSYSTSKAHFREIACIVAGTNTTVVVAAAPVADWAQKAAFLDRAIASFST
jgi:hypothetical protein